MSFTVGDLLRWIPEASLRTADGGPCASPPSTSLVGATVDSHRAGPDILFVGVQGERTHGARYLAPALEAGCPAALIEGERPVLEGQQAPVLVVDDARAALAAAARGYLDRFAPRVVAITGSNGKTTTKDFTRAALSTRGRVGANPGNLNSRWGLPLAVLSQRGDEEILVLEMGASEPDEIGRLADLVRPTLGCVTNVAPAHLERFGSVDAVADTKAQLLDRLPPDGAAVLNRDDARFASLRARSAAKRVVSFGRDEAADLRLEDCRQEADGLRVRIGGREQRLPLFGEVNGLNAAAACALAGEFGVGTADALGAMAEASLSPHRSRLERVEGRHLLDDCYNANPASMASALESLRALPVSGRRIAVLGDMAELGEATGRHHRELAASAQGRGVDALVAAGERLREAARVLALAVDTTFAESPEDPAELGAWLAERSRPGDAFLFKASRSQALERVVDAFRETLGGAGGGR